MALPSRRAPLLVLLLAGCVPTPDGGFGTPPTPEDDASDGGSIVVVGPEPTPCADSAPVEQRLIERGLERGLDAILDDPAEAPHLTPFDHGGRIVVADLDDDGDLDLVFGMTLAAPLLFDNDGGSFARIPATSSGLQMPAGIDELVSLSAVDLGGDGLPEIVAGGPWEVVVWPNLGGFRFGEPRPIHRIDLGPKVLISTVVFGDADTDGILDAYVATSGIIVSDQGPRDTGAPDFLLIGRGDGTFEPAKPMIVGGEGSSSLVAAFVDVDADGAQEILVVSDGEAAEPTALWKRDPTEAGTPSEWRDIGPETGLDPRFAGMGMDIADLNGDRRPDFCMTDIGAPVCLLSDGAGRWYEAGAALGLHGAEAQAQIGWGFEIADLDNDGDLDALQASGPAMDSYDPDADPPMQDLLWEGQADGSFAPGLAQPRFGSTRNHLGVVAADLDGDGAVEVLLAGPSERPLLYANRCSDARWLEVALEGPPGNPSAFGATVTVEAGGRAWTRTLHSARGPAQGPPLLHFGLGEIARIDRMIVLWPGGQRTVLAEVPLSRRVTVAAP